MTDPLDAYGDALRRALHADADAVVPSADGLERIRTRINERQRRFGWVWLTENWSRPAVALGAAMFIAVVAISATPALHAIEAITAGDRGSAGSGGPDHSVTNPAEIPGQPGNPGQSAPGSSSSVEPTSSPSPLESPRLGTPTCAPPAGSVPSPSSSQARNPRQDTCASPPPAATPTPAPPTTPVEEPTPTDALPSSSEPPGPMVDQQEGDQTAP